MDMIGQFYDLTASPQTEGVITLSVWESGWVVCDRNVVEGLWIMRKLPDLCRSRIRGSRIPTAMAYDHVIASWDVTRRRLVLSYRGFEDSLSVLSSGGQAVQEKMELRGRSKT
jgi:hypothetical protein